MINEQQEDISQAIRVLRTIKKVQKNNLSQMFTSGEAKTETEKNKEEIKKDLIDKIEKIIDSMLEEVNEDVGIGYLHEKLGYGHSIILAPLLTDGRLADDNREARKSELTSLWRKAVFERDGYKCVNGCESKNIHAHHKTQWSESTEKRFDVDNGETLCVDCHAAQHPKMANLIKSTSGRQTNERLGKKNKKDSKQKDINK